MTKPQRKIAAAQKAGRAAIERGLAADLNKTDLKVLLVLLHQIPFFDHLDDFVANSVMAKMTGVDGRHVRRSLVKLNELGVIERWPGESPRGGQRVASFVVFEEVDDDLLPGAVSAPGTDTDRGQNSTPTGGRNEQDRGQNHAPTGGSHAPASVGSSVRSPSVLSVGSTIVDQRCTKCDTPLAPNDDGSISCRECSITYRRAS